MTKDTLPPQLYLLVPWDLPVEQQLSEANKDTLRQALQQLLQALVQTSDQEALAMITQGLANLDLSDVFLASVSSTKTPLKPWEVEDFDNYFNVTHVQSQEPAVCIVWSLLTAYQLFLTLNRYGSNFDPNQVELLKKGFRTYVYLLERVFYLGLEKTS